MSAAAGLMKAEVQVVHQALVDYEKKLQKLRKELAKDGITAPEVDDKIRLIRGDGARQGLMHVYTSTGAVALDLFPDPARAETDEPAPTERVEAPDSIPF